MFDKLLTVLSKNLGYSVILAVALLLFALFSDGLVAGLITAVSALLVYTCASALYKQLQLKKAPLLKRNQKNKLCPPFGGFLFGLYFYFIMGLFVV